MNILINCFIWLKTTKFIKNLQRNKCKTINRRVKLSAVRNSAKSYWALPGSSWSLYGTVQNPTERCPSRHRVRLVAEPDSAETNLALSGTAQKRAERCPDRAYSGYKLPGTALSKRLLPEASLLTSQCQGFIIIIAIFDNVYQGSRWVCLAQGLKSLDIILERS